MGAQQNYVSMPVMRVIHSDAEDAVRVSNSEMCAFELRNAWDDRLFTKQERIYALFINKNREIVGRELINAGNYMDTQFSLNVIVYLANYHDVNRVVIAHNHPESNLAEPSQQDLTTTKKAVAFLSELNIHLIDHLILTTGNYYSFADNNLLK